MYTGCPLCPGSGEYLGKYVFKKKIFQAKVAIYEVMYLVMLAV